MNAIILAAGLGSRFKDVTKKIHKSLLPINGIPNIENTIQNLIEAGIDDIYIVTGHLSEQFSYLKEKYKCKILNNEKYKEFNNIYSFYKAINHFGDSFVIDSDVVIFKNIFIGRPKTSLYFLITRPKSNKEEWIPIIKKDKIDNIIVSNDYLPSLLGISYWSKSDAEKIKEHIRKFMAKNILLDNSLYWDNIPMQILSDLNVGYKELSIHDAYEIDSIEEYHFALTLNHKN